MLARKTNSLCLCGAYLLLGKQITKPKQAHGWESRAMEAAGEAPGLDLGCQGQSRSAESSGTKGTRELTPRLPPHTAKGSWC